jgi:hypothetical protein
VRECVVYWYSIQYPLHRSGYASQSRVVVCMMCVCLYGVCLYVNVCWDILGAFSL